MANPQKCKQVFISSGPIPSTLTDNGNGTLTFSNGIDPDVTFNNGVPDTDTDTSIRFVQALPTGEWEWEVVNVITNTVLSTFTTPPIVGTTAISTDGSVEFTTTPTGYDYSVTHMVNPDGSVTLNDGTVIPAETITTIVNNGDGTATFTNEDGAVVTFPIGGVSIVDNADGTYLVTLADGSTITIGDTSISTLVDNGDNTYTYTDETGGATTFDVTGVLTTVTNTIVGNKIADYTDEAGGVTPINESITSFASITNGWQFTSEDGTVYPFTFTFDNSTPSAPQLLVNYGATIVATIPLNSYDVNITTTGGFTLNPVTDVITITETDGETHTIDLSYLRSTITSTDGSVEIVTSINPDGSTNYDLGAKAPSNETQAVPYTGVELPTTAGVNIGDTKTVKYSNCKVVNYTWNGSSWVYNSLVDYVDLNKEESVLLPTFSGIGWTGSGIYTTSGLNTEPLIANITLEDNTTYVLRFDVVITGGNLIAYVGGERRATGATNSYVEYFTTQSDNRILFENADGGFSGSVSNITLHKVIGCKQIYHTRSEFMSPIYLNDGQIETNQGANIAIGHNVSRNNTYDNYNIAGSSVAIGNYAGNDGHTTVLGYFAGNKNEPQGVLTAVGKWAGLNNTTGHASFFGNACGRSNTTSDSHAFGDECLSQNQTEDMSAFGYYALQNATSGNQSAFGHEALRYAISGRSTAMGYYAGRLNYTGTLTALGANAAEYYSAGTTVGGIFIGDYAGVNPGTTDFSYTNGEDNAIVIGNRVRKSDTSPMPNTLIIGNDLRADVPNQIKIGTSNTNNYLNMVNGNLGINKGSHPLYKVDVEGNLDNIQGYRITNINAGSSASADLVLQNTGGSASFSRLNNGLTTYNNDQGYTRFIQSGIVGFRFMLGGVDKINLTPDGLGINTTAPNAALDVNGAIHVSGAFAPSGVSVPNGTIFKGTDGALYYKGGSGTVTMIAPN